MGAERTGGNFLSDSQTYSSSVVHLDWAGYKWEKKGRLVYEYI